MATRRLPAPRPAYSVRPAAPFCRQCGRDRGFDIIGPDGIGTGTTYELEVDADEMAEALNSAYNLGQHAARAKRKKK